MEVRLFPNSRRPGVGLKPRRESHAAAAAAARAALPGARGRQRAGLHGLSRRSSRKESFHLELRGRRPVSSSSITCRPRTASGTPIFQVTMSLPVGRRRDDEGRSDVRGRARRCRARPRSRVARVFLVPEDMGTPPGALALRGATNFQTPAGWDTVYTPIFNMIERPVAPMLVVRVETDWYAHETEFRYVLQPGEGHHRDAQHSDRPGVFVPREEITLRDCTDEEFKAIEESASRSSRATRPRPRRPRRTACRTARTTCARAARRPNPARGLSPGESVPPGSPRKHEDTRDTNTKKTKGFWRFRVSAATGSGASVRRRDRRGRPCRRSPRW